MIWKSNQEAPRIPQPLTTRDRFTRRRNRHRLTALSR